MEDDVNGTAPRKLDLCFRSIQAIVGTPGPGSEECTVEGVLLEKHLPPSPGVPQLADYVRLVRLAWHGAIDLDEQSTAQCLQDWHRSHDDAHIFLVAKMSSAKPGLCVLLANDLGEFGLTMGYGPCPAAR